MRLNIFAIPTNEVSRLKTKLRASRMEVIKQVTQSGWQGSFYYSLPPAPGEIDWAETYRDYFSEVGMPSNLNYYAVYLFEKDSVCYALSYGKSHFYLRSHCNYDFGVELAKRVANELDIKQTASKRFQGKKKKDIKSYASNTRLDVESGESIDYLQASIIEPKVEAFGKSGKFGTSALISPDITTSEIGDFLNKLNAEMRQSARFKLPRTTIITERSETDVYDQLLVNELMAPVGTTEFAHNSYDLYGVDFVFTNDGTFKLWCPKYPRIELEELTIKELKDYIREYSVASEDVLGIKITHMQEDRPKYTTPILHAVDFIADGQNVILSGGRWMRFNQDYLEYLDNYLKTITVEEPEEEFREISLTEPDFNSSRQIRDAGYEVADKDFSIFRTRATTPIEAWDLKKGNCIYAVKFGTAQKLGYVCDQASAILELLRNRANVNQIPDFDKYCLWLGYRGQTQLDSITGSGSIILKQKIETWVRKARELGIEPVIKISRKMKPGIDI
jgi:uncharacterized protein (TIGR04141 family)